MCSIRLVVVTSFGGWAGKFCLDCPVKELEIYCLEYVSSLAFRSYKKQVPPSFELGSLDSKSRVLTITPWGRCVLSNQTCFGNSS